MIGLAKKKNYVNLPVYVFKFFEKLGSLVFVSEEKTLDSKPHILNFIKCMQIKPDNLF